MARRFWKLGLLVVLLGGAVAWGQEGEWRAVYEGRAYYPRGVELRDGGILVTFDHAVGGGRAIGCVRSGDGGKTWGEYRRIVEDGGRVDVANAFPIQLEDGTILVAYRHHRLEEKDYRLVVVASGDGGRTWEKRGTIVSGKVGVWEPFLLAAGKDVLQAYYASEEGIYPDQRIEMKTSRDGGRTWGAAVTVARKKGSRDGMPTVARAGDGALVACFEASDVWPFRFVVRVVRSRDEGVTWGEERELVYRPRNAAEGRWAAGAPYLVRDKAGRMVVSFQTDEDVGYRKGDVNADPAMEGYRYERHTRVKVVRSEDGGKSWGEAVTIAGEEGAATWAGLCGLKEGRVLGLVTWRGRSWGRALGEGEKAKR